MSTRWWAPGRATLEPDAVVLALLVPGDDPAGDLGNVILAAHRAGAAACEHAAKAGLVSKSSLIAALAVTRGHLAGPMVTAVSKSMDGAYAGLLVTDLFDDAESAALTLYGTAVARNVSPSAAASRVGAVFGVPTAAMGRYQPLAIDPKTNPVVLADAADRALMSYVAKLVDFELGAEPVSKAVVGFKDDDHPRGGGGRFVAAGDSPAILEPHILAQLRDKFGGGGQVAPQVGPVAEPVAARRTRKTRQVRSTRKVRQEEHPIEHKIGHQIGHQIGHMSPGHQILHRVLEKMNPRVLEPARTFMPDLLSLPDPAAAGAHDANSYEIGKRLVFGVPAAADNDFHTKLRIQANQQADPTTAIFRIGHLLNAAGRPDPEVASHKNQTQVDAQDGLAAAAIKMVEKTGYVEPQARAILFDQEESHPADPRKYSRQLTEWLENKRQEEFKTERTLRSGAVVRDDNAAEDEFVKVMPKYVPLAAEDNEHDYGAMYLVHYLPADKSHPRSRPQPSITEYVLPAGAIGTEDGPGTDLKMDFTLDPNTAYKIVRPGNMSDEKGKVKPVRMWDPRRKVVVNRYYLRPIDEAEVEAILGPEIKKADTFVATAHPRDPMGLWIKASQQAVEAEEAAMPRARQTRKTRKTRSVRQVRQQMEAATPAIRHQIGHAVAHRVGHAMSHSIKHAMIEHAQDKRKALGLPAMPALSDSSHYLLFTEAAQRPWNPETGSSAENESDLFSYITDAIGDSDKASMMDGATISLNHVARERVATAKSVEVSQLGNKMNMNIDMELMGRMGSEDHTIALGSLPFAAAVKPSFGGLAEDEADPKLIAGKINEIFDQNHDIDQVTLHRRGDRLVFYGSTTPTSKQHIIELDPDLDPDLPMEMRYLGEYRAHDIQVVSEDEVPDTLSSVSWNNSEQAVVSPRLQIFKVTNPVARRYGVNNA